MKQKLRKRMVCFLLVFCCLFSLMAFPVSADSEDTEITDARDFIDFPAIWGNFEGYHPFVETAVKRGLIQGYPDNTFRPEAPLKQGDAVLVLFRLHKRLEEKVLSPGATEAFPDASPYQREALLWAERAGLLEGYPEGLRPQEAVTKGGIAVLFYRYLQLLGEESRYEENPDYEEERTASPLENEAMRALSGWEIFPDLDPEFRSFYEVDRLVACVCFVRLLENLSLPVIEEATPRLKFAVEREPVEEKGGFEEKYDFEEPWILSTMEEYKKYLFSLQMGFPRKDPQPGEADYTQATVTEIPQPNKPEITEEFFRENRLVVVEKWSKHFFLWDRELSQVELEGDKVKLAFVAGCDSPEEKMDGLIYLIAVPKSVTSVDCETLYWTEADPVVVPMEELPAAPAQ